MITNYSRYLLLINGAVLMGCAVFDFSWRDTLLIAFMLFLPFIDRQWRVPKYKPYKYQLLLLLLVIGAASLILVSNPDKLNLILYTTLLVALPEEWFFRAYYLPRLESICNNRWTANMMTSLLFAVLHLPAQGWFGLTVFLPSFFIGWVYQRHRDIVLVILIHAFLNMIYFVYLKNSMEALFF